MKKLVLFWLLMPILGFAQKPQLVIKTGLKTGVQMASISPDNKLALTIEQDEILILWDLKSGKQLQSFPDILAADFVLDNQTIDIVTKDYSFKTIDFNGKIIKENPIVNTGDGKGSRLHVQFYRNTGTVLVDGDFITRDKGTLGRPFKGLPIGFIKNYSEKLNQVLITTDTEVRTGDVTNEKLLKVYKPNQFNIAERDKHINFAKFSPDGKYLLAGNDYTLDVIDIETSQSVYSLNYWNGDKDHFMTTASISANNAKLLILTSDSTILVQLTDKKVLWRKPHEVFGSRSRGAVVKFSDDEQIALIGDNRTLNAINVSNGETLSKLIGIKARYINDNWLHEKANALIISQSYRIINWNLASGKLESSTEFDHHNDAQTNQKADKVYSYWAETDVKTGVKKDFEYHDRVDGITKISLSFDDQSFLHIGEYENKELRDPYGINHYKLIVADVATKKIIWRRNQVNEAKFANTSATIAVINKHRPFNSIQLLEGRTGKLIRTLALPKKIPSATRLNFSPNDKFLTFFNTDTLVVIELATGKFTEIDKKLVNGHIIYSAKFLNDNQTLMFSDYKGGIHFYDFTKQELLANKKLNAAENIISGMSFTKNDRYLFTNSNDNKVKLWELQTMELLATLYPSDNGNWAIITPNGQFDASLGAQKDIYFVKGIETYPLTALYEKYFTPNLLPRLLAGERFEPVGFNELFKAPSVKISYEQKTRNLTVETDQPNYQNTPGLAEITVTATATEGKVDEIRLFHNGKTLTLTTRNLIIADDNEPTTVVKKYSVNLLPGQNSIRAIALNAQRTESQPDEISVIYAANGQPAPIPNKNVGTLSGPIDQIDKDATLHLMVVGINAYTEKINPLTYALPDATAFKEEIEKDAKSVLANVKTYFISDAKANSEGIKNALKEIKKNAKPKDVFIFYYAGHGYIHPTTKEFYLVSSDVTDAGESLLKNGIAAKELQNYAVDILAQKQLFILDACQSAGAYEKMLKHDGEQQKSLAVVSRSTGTHWIAASGSTETAKEFSQLGHGAFTYVLLQALKGQASNNKMITVNGLKDFLQIKVPEVVKKYGGNSQLPSSYGFGNDFAVELIK